MMLVLICSLLCLLLIRAGTAGAGGELQCSVTPAGALHPVRAQLERFEAGPGCAAREPGAKETHVITVGRANVHEDKKVTVVLRPLSFSRPLTRPVILVLSSQHAVHWTLENEGLPESLRVLVQVSVNSTVDSGDVSKHVHSIPTLPWRPQALLRWTLQRHTTISSLTHSSRANRVYLRLGEDPSMPSVCHLQPLFLSPNYMASELQEQEFNGCTPSGKSFNPEVHVIKLWSAGSGLCGSLQVEVSVSLLPPVADAGWYNLVLVLSSAAPVNWALVTQGLRGHITVYSSHSVTPLYPPKPDLAMTSITVPDLLTSPDLLGWTNHNNLPAVASYTEANLANRFVVRLGAGKAVEVVVEAKEEERKLRDWLSAEHEDGADGSREAVSTVCLEGRLNVSVDKSVLQALSLSVSTVTLRDPWCQAQSNATHFLLAFPVISCGTEGEMNRQGTGVQYKNMVLLWKHKPLMDLHNKTEWRMIDESAPLVIHFSCVAPLPTTPSSLESSSSSQPQEAPHRTSGSALPWPLTPHGAPPLSMQLFSSQRFQQRAVGPCVITARSRIYVQINSLAGKFQVHSCVISPLSDPNAHPGWPVVQNSCPADPSFLLHEEVREKKDEVESDEEEREEAYLGDAEKEEDEKKEERDRKIVGKRVGRTERTRDNGEGEKEEEEEEEGERRMLKQRRLQNSDERRRRSEMEERLRFSFVLKPVFNNSIQFLHCTLQICSRAAGTRWGPSGAASLRDCTRGGPKTALSHTPAVTQCEHRNLSRPVLVTYSLTEGLAGLLPPPAGHNAQKTEVRATQMSRHSSSAGVIDTGPMLIIAFVAFLLGVSLMWALWCIYSCTGKPTVVNKDSLLETMGDSQSSWNQINQLDQASSSV